MKQALPLLLLGIAVCLPVQGQPPKPSPQNEFAAHILTAAEAGASNLQGVDRAYAYWLISRVFASVSLPQEREALKKSCQAAVAPETDAENLAFREKIQLDCIRRMMALQPKAASQLLGMATANVRQQILAGQAAKTASSGDLDAALTMLSSEVGQGARYPYERALEVMRALPKDDRNGKDRVFAQALGYYRQKKNGIDVGMEDLGTLVVRFWRDLSPGLVLVAIDDILDSAQQETAADSHLEVKLTSGSDVVAFGSLYQYRLFQLLPVIRAFDPSRADDLLRQNAQAGSTLAKYTSGLASLSGNYSDTPGNDETFTMNLQMSSGPGQANADASVRTSEIYRQADQILASIKKEPDAGLRAAVALPDENGPTGSPKAELLLRIARLLENDHPDIAVSSLQEMHKVIDGFRLLDQCRYLVLIGEEYLRLKKPDLARSVVTEIMPRLKELYKIDTNSDGPNLAPKSSWPSTVVSRASAVLAAQVSSKFADTTIQELPDPDLQVFARIERAGNLVAMPSYPALVQQRRKREKGQSVLAFPMPSGRSLSRNEPALN